MRIFQSLIPLKVKIILGFTAVILLLSIVNSRGYEQEYRHYRRTIVGPESGSRGNGGRTNGQRGGDFGGRLVFIGDG